MYRVMSFFSGAGGLDLGFHQAGFEIVYSNELESLFAASMKANIGKYVSKNTIISDGDIRKIKIDELPNQIDFIIGGPPCQTFSASGRRAGGASGQLDQRGTLFQVYGEIISRKQPLGFLFENVRGILGSNKGRDWEDIKLYFASLGYNLDYRVLDACDYGAPQHRERLILVGHKMDSEFFFPKPTHGPDSSTQTAHITAKKAFEKVINNDEADSLSFNGGKYSHLLKEVPPGENYLFFTEKRGYPKPIFAYRSRFSDFLYKANPDSPTKTVIASPGKYTGPLHWENRYFTVQEYKALQGFPQDYVLLGKRSEQIKQIGNAVSPYIAIKLAEAVKLQLFNDESSRIELIDKATKLSFDQRKGRQAQKTRSRHLEIAKNKNRRSKYKIKSYKSLVQPITNDYGLDKNVTVTRISTREAYIEVHGDSNTDQPFISCKLGFGIINKGNLFEDYERILTIRAYGKADHTIQTMWNSIDDWVINSSNFHSLFETYGHFTEPHPDFKILSFEVHTDHPIGIFAKYASNFSNCSKFFKKRKLMKQFLDFYGKEDFIDLLEYLRKYRFDVRSYEINIAIDKGEYMICYPFTLPLRKQMNFKAQRQIITSEI